MPAACPFCNFSETRVFLRAPGVVGLWDAYPVSPGHALLVPLEQWELTTRTIGAAGVMPERMVIVCRKRDRAAKPPLPANCKN